MGIELKPGYDLKNLWAMPLCLVAATIAGTYTNTEIIFLLQHKDYFNTPKEDIGKRSNALIFYSIPIAMISTFIVGQIFDAIGRRPTLFFSILLGCFCMVLVPYTAPNFYLLLLVKMGVQISL